MVTINTPKRKGTGKVIFLRRTESRTTPHADAEQTPDPIAESIGAFADYPLWDEFLAEIEKNRREQNQRMEGQA